MSLGNDFLELVSLLWEIEEFDMWIPKEHGSLAYLMDRLYGTSEYVEKYDKIKTFATEKNANELANYISCEIVAVAQNDNTIGESDKLNLDAMLVRQRKNYEDNALTGFGIVQEKYMPNWFFEIFSGYIKLEEAKRETLILQYCKAEQMSQEQAEEAYKKLSTQYDLLNEFYFYVKNKKFKTYYPRTVKKLSAKHLYETICNTPLSAYLYLVYLREEPEKALAEYEDKISTINNKNKDKVEEQIPMEETKQVEVENEGGEQAIPTPLDDNVVLEKLEALQQAMQGLQECFDSKIATDAHKNGLFDNMHKELTRYQNGAMDKIVDTIALDIIQLVDTTKGHLRVYEKKEPNEENYKRLLRIVKGVTEDLQDILYRQSIEAYRVEGHEVDVRRQKIIQTIPTDNQSKDNLVAVRAADGYEKDGKVLRPERIKIFKYSTEAANNSEGN